MLELNGIYSEYGMFSWDSITVEHIEALEALGFVLRWDYENRLIEVVYDTAVMDHKRCEELDNPLGLDWRWLSENKMVSLGVYGANRVYVSNGGDSWFWLGGCGCYECSE